MKTSAIQNSAAAITPLHSLQAGTWFKLICGASYQALPAIRNLALAYSLAGVDCIDVAADPAVMAAAKEGMDAAEKVARQKTRAFNRPWLMVSMSVGEDPHFRKAWFDASVCPADCPRPCESICPADAIDADGVVRDRCYGCGRCLPVCPLGLIEARAQPTSLDAIAQQVLTQADALEIHTQVGHYSEFKALCQTIQSQASHLKLISVSCPDSEGLIDYLSSLRNILRNILKHSTEQSYGVSAGKAPIVVWQTDGRPMSGDIGKGTTHATIRMAQKVLASGLSNYVQLAGGTNQHTVPKLQALGLLNRSQEKEIKAGQTVSGIAYGSYARHLLAPVIEQTLYLEEVSPTLWEAVALAESLVKPLKNPL